MTVTLKLDGDQTVFPPAQFRPEIGCSYIVVLSTYVSSLVHLVLDIAGRRIYKPCATTVAYGDGEEILTLRRGPEPCPWCERARWDRKRVWRPEIRNHSLLGVLATTERGIEGMLQVHELFRWSYSEATLRAIEKAIVNWLAYRPFTSKFVFQCGGKMRPRLSYARYQGPRVYVRKDLRREYERHVNATTLDGLAKAPSYEEAKRELEDHFDWLKRGPDDLLRGHLRGSGGVGKPGGWRSGMCQS